MLKNNAGGSYHFCYVNISFALDLKLLISLLV